MKTPHRLPETSLNTPCVVRTILILPYGSERVKLSQGEEKLFLHDSYGPFGFKWFYLFFCIKEKKKVTHTKAVDAQRINLTSCSIHCFPSAPGEDSA